MSDSEREELRAIWRKLAKHNNWSLVANEEAFLDQAAAQLHHLEGTNTSVHPQIAIQRTYSVLLYRGLQGRSNEAASELWMAMFRLSLKKGWSEADAQDLAQEAVARVFERWHTLKEPHSLLSWAIMLLQTVWRDYRTRDARASGDELVEDCPAPVQIMAAVEHGILMEALALEISRRLTNPLEHTVFMRWLFLGDKPGDVAEDLGLPPHRTRIAKYRATQRLEADEEFRAIVRRLADADDRSETGGV